MTLIDLVVCPELIEPVLSDATGGMIVICASAGSARTVLSLLAALNAIHKSAAGRKRDIHKSDTYTAIAHGDPGEPDALRTADKKIAARRPLFLSRS